METKMKTKNGFTLSETLITLTILGVVAVIIIPNIVNNFQKRAYVTKLQRFYSDMQSTIDQFIVYNNNKMELFSPVHFYSQNNDTEFVKFLDEKYGDLYSDVTSNNSWISRSCELWQNKKGGQYKNLHGDINYNGTNNFPFRYHDYAMKTYKTKYGSQFEVQAENGYPGTGVWYVVVDVNGPDKAPNQIGRDVFHLIIRGNNGLEPRANVQSYGWHAWHPEMDTYEIGCNVSQASCGNLISNCGCLCAKRIIENGWKMDY